MFLTSAISIDLDAQTGTSSIAPELNIAQTKVNEGGWVSAVQWDLRADLATVRWNFLWQPPRDGMMNVISALAMNGWGGAYPGPVLRQYPSNAKSVGSEPTMD